MGIALLFFLIIFSAIGAVVLYISAKRIGKITNASFGNSFLICLIAGSICSLILYSLAQTMGSGEGMMALAKLGFIGMLLLNIIILSGVYIFVGKNIWKCEWIQSAKANAPWIIFYAIISGYFYSSIH